MIHTVHGWRASRRRAKNSFNVRLAMQRVIDGVLMACSGAIVEI